MREKHCLVFFPRPWHWLLVSWINWTRLATLLCSLPLTKLLRNWAQATWSVSWKTRRSLQVCCTCDTPMIKEGTCIPGFCLFGCAEHLDNFSHAGNHIWKVGPLLVSTLKCIKDSWLNYHEILYRHSCSLSMTPSHFGDCLTPFASLAAQTCNQWASIKLHRWIGLEFLLIQVNFK